MKKGFTIAFAFAIFSAGLAQQIEPCGYNQVIQNLETQYPGFRESYDKAYLGLVFPKEVNNRKTKIKDTTYFYDTIYHIPVVFHVLYNNSAENIHDSLLKSQIEVLNRDYNRSNLDTGNTRAIFKPRAGNPKIQFELASLTPNGTSTTGIIRKSTSLNTFGTSNGQISDAAKFSSQGGDDAWNPDKYLNIWVCDLYYPSSGNFLFGYAYPPYGHPNWSSFYWVSNPNQGVVLHYQIVGKNNPQATGTWSISNNGRTATHEVGHYLGLRHISGDPTSPAQQCAVDDYLEDTPKQSRQSPSDCNFNQNTCFESTGKDFPDNVENYMDYSKATCQNMFTKQQARIMTGTLSSFRSNLPLKIDIVKRMRIFDTVAYNDLKIYANNKDHKIVCELRNTDLLENLKLDVYDANGKILFKEIVLSKNENFISSVTFSPGLYCAVVKRTDTNKPVKIVKLFVNKG